MSTQGEEGAFVAGERNGQVIAIDIGGSSVKGGIVDLVAACGPRWKSCWR